jgi:hypothetical protein
MTKLTMWVLAGTLLIGSALTFATVKGQALPGGNTLDPMSTLVKTLQSTNALLSTISSQLDEIDCNTRPGCR